VPGISNTILVNLGGSNDNSNDEEEEEDHNNTTANWLKSLVNKEAPLCKEAIGKENQKQQTSAIKAMKKCRRAALENGVRIGAMGSLKVNY
jgi:hypothetical protein